MIYIPAGDVDDLLVVLGVGVCASPIYMKEGKEQKKSREKKRRKEE
jgi:hypothetical protein